ncbi:MAG TPA: CBS domain-containing protein, partial [Thermoanaerobaculales bacterium]|nr:CBS domain-containing protein [Thermoanaerobaculales bacterium]
MSEQASERALVDEVHALLREGEEDSLRIFLRLVRPEDIAGWLDLLDVEDRQRILAALDHETAGRVLDDTTVSIRAELVEELDPERLARIAETMPADEAADLIGELEVADSEQVLRHIDDEDERVLRHLLRFPEDTAGGIMNPEVVALEPTATVDDAIAHLRSIGPDTVTASLYVVDATRRLLGFVRLRRLVTAPPSAQLGHIMSSDVITVRVDADQEEVADLVDKYD